MVTTVKVTKLTPIAIKLFCGSFLRITVLHKIPNYLNSDSELVMLYSCSVSSQGAKWVIWNLLMKNTWDNAECTQGWSFVFYNFYHHINRKEPTLEEERKKAHLIHQDDWWQEQKRWFSKKGSGYKELKE